MSYTNTKGKGYIIYEAASNSLTPTLISEQPKFLKFTAELQEAETPNRNRRIYSKEAIDSGIKHYTVQEKLRTKTFYGECNHPLSGEPKRQMFVDQRNVSHIVTELYWKNDGNKLMGTIETADTLAGRDMRGLIMQGSQAAFSMRGISDNVKKDGPYQRVGSPLMIVTYDWITLPSHPESYMLKENTGFLSEAVTNAMYEQDDERLKVINEGILTPYNASDMLNYAINMSSNVNEMAELYGFDIRSDLDGVSIDKNKVLSIKEGSETLRIFLEENIKNDLDDFYTTFKF